MRLIRSKEWWLARVAREPDAAIGAGSLASNMNMAQIHVASMRERFWRWAGFHYHLGDEPEGADNLEGWTCTVSRMHFGWADRLRLVLTGRLMVKTILHTDTPSAMVCKTRMDWSISAPGER